MEYKLNLQFNEQALEIEDAETRILTLCKKAVNELYSKDRFKSAVDGIIDELCKKLTNDTLKDKARKALRLYAQKTYTKVRQIMRETAFFYAIVLLGVQSGRREAIKQQRAFKADTTESFRGSKGFQKLIKEAPYSVYPTRVPLDTYYKRYIERVKELTEELVTSGAKEDYATNVSLRNIAEMTVRYEHQVNMIEQKRQSGVKLVYILPHANCSKRCEKYQVGGSLHPSGLYSLDGSTGVTKEGVKYRPLEFATDNPIDRYTTKAGITYQNGCITGFGCRHILDDYKPGAKPIAIPEKVIEKRREIEQKQREYERQIRQYKKASIALKDIDSKTAKKMRKLAIEANAKYKAFSKKHNVAYFPDRTKLLEDD